MDDGHLWLGHEELDRQHRELSLAAKRVKASGSQYDMTIAINDFFELWRTHTQFEEKLMSEFKYPHKRGHANDHLMITHEISCLFKNSLSSGFIPPSAIEKRMRHWFEGHFHAHDTPMFRYMMAEAGSPMALSDEAQSQHLIIRSLPRQPQLGG